MSSGGLESPDDISLDAHALIEASAGTGKTYTIENLVLRIIRQRGVEIVSGALHGAGANAFDAGAFGGFVNLSPDFALRTVLAVR